MGTFDSAQVDDLKRIYILNTSGRIVRMTELSLSWTLTPAKTFKIEKIVRSFKLLGLQIEIASKLKIVDFLDYALNLNNDTFKPFSKSNFSQTYMNTDSNQPRSLLKLSPNAVNRRINRLSSCKKFSKRSKVYMMKPTKKRFKCRQECVNPVNSNSNGKSNTCGTHALFDTNDNHSNRRGNIEIVE